MKIKTGILAALLSATFLLATATSIHAVEVGQKAPDFELESTKGGRFKLSSLRGKNVLINFYVLDFSPVWIKQLHSSGSDDTYAKFQTENTEVLGISANATFSQKAFVDFAKIKHPLLSDLSGKVMQTFGVWDEERRLAKRSYIIVDKEGIVRFNSVRPGNGETNLLSTETLLNEVKKINRGS